MPGRRAVERETCATCCNQFTADEGTTLCSVSLTISAKQSEVRRKMAFGRRTCCGSFCACLSKRLTNHRQQVNHEHGSHSDHHVSHEPAGNCRGEVQERPLAFNLSNDLVLPHDQTCKYCPLETATGAPKLACFVVAFRTRAGLSTKLRASPVVPVAREIASGRLPAHCGGRL